MAIRVGVFFGGKTVEHEVSIISAIQAINAFDKEKYTIVPIYITKNGDFYTGEATATISEYKDIPALLKKSKRVIVFNEKGEYQLISYPIKKFGNPVVDTFDVAFPIVHGTNVEDGALQGFLKTLSIPFVGPDVTASALGMDKFAMKTVWKYCDLPILDAKRLYVKQYFQSVDESIADLEGSFSYPMIVKPLNLGSSVGIRKARTSGELKEALEYAFLFANYALVEPAITNLREINCAVLGDKESAKASECEEPLTTADILSYEDKYVNGGKQSKGSAKGMSGAKRKLPADLSYEQREYIRDLAIRAFQALDVNGVSRVDFLIDTDNDKVYLNEINTIPGSLAFYLWEPTGLKYSQLLDELVMLALKRRREEENISYAFDTNILSQYEGGLKGAKGKL
ncbi:MAG: D-alanine--D-alanine ligase [Lachnospiraceae bacterium]|jgi:D-alanine-D-alanine ligase|nr:D-alanine--D-alanine ligase [Lachnospiraceae bacterium]